MHSLATHATPRRRGSTSVGLAWTLVFVCAPAFAFEWQVDITPSAELFPSLELSQTPATPTSPGNGDGLLEVHVSGSDLPQHLRLQVDTPGLRAPARIEAYPHGAAIELRPRLDWDSAALRTLQTPRNQVLRISLEADGRPAQTRSVNVRVHPLGDALYFVREGRDRVDLGWAFAGYVDPHDATVDAVLALARSIEADFDTPGENAQDTALRRVGAVWAALERRGLRYADGDPSLSRGPVVYSQRVRLLDETWQERRANCLDGSVLIASVLERLGLRAVIVLVPAHAFVGFRTATDARATTYLETTLLGAASFANARRAGAARWRKAAAKLDGRHGPDYALIDIATARAYGIVPLAVHDGGAAARRAAGTEPPADAVQRAQPFD